jgi:formate hydrogenlyase subunit 3/multisubunit Na+/H+ antiporter MnhD subunit
MTIATSWSTSRTICTTLGAVTTSLHFAATYLPEQVSLGDNIKKYNTFAAIGFTALAAFPIFNYFASKALTDKTIYPIPQIGGGLAMLAVGLLARPYFDQAIAEAMKFTAHYQATSPQVNS